jgi:hypothetical protein
MRNLKSKIKKIEKKLNRIEKLLCLQRVGLTARGKIRAAKSRIFTKRRKPGCKFYNDNHSLLKMSQLY